MSLHSVAKEVMAAGIGLDIAGAVFLGLAVLHSPLVVASHILSDPNLKTTTGRPGLSTQPVEHAVAAMLQGRVGVVCLLLGFTLQLVGLLLPTGGNHYGAPVVIAILSFELARRVGVRWITRNWTALEHAVWSSPRITTIVDREEMLRAHRGKPKWQDHRVVEWLRRGFGPPKSHQDNTALRT